MHYYIDASYVVRASRARSKVYTEGANGDLWTRVYRRLDAIGNNVTISKVKSHITSNEEWEAHQMCFMSALLNRGADNAADAAAERYAQNFRSTEQLCKDNKHLHTAASILTRSAIVEQHMHHYHDNHRRK